MKTIMLSAVCLLLLCSCEDENAHKTIDWYMQHREAIEADVQKCDGIAEKNQDNWCASAYQAQRNVTAERIGNHAKEAIKRQR